jgi:hypothetical protein
MSLDVKFSRPDNKPLGTVEAVQQAILAVLPEVRFYRDPGGEQKIAQHEAHGVELPEALRAVFAKPPAIIKGDYGREKDGLWLQFFLGAGGDPRILHVAVKGDMDTAEILLNRLASAHDWELSAYAPSDEQA